MAVLWSVIFPVVVMEWCKVFHVVEVWGISLPVWVSVVLHVLVACVLRVVLVMLWGAYLHVVVVEWYGVFCVVVVWDVIFPALVVVECGPPRGGGMWSCVW